MPTFSFRRFRNKNVFIVHKGNPNLTSLCIFFFGVLFSLQLNLYPFLNPGIPTYIQSLLFTYLRCLEYSRPSSTYLLEKKLKTQHQTSIRPVQIKRRHGVALTVAPRELGSMDEPR